MIQNFLSDPMMQNYMAPCYPIYIQIRYLLSTITNKKTMKTAKSDIVNLVSQEGFQAQRFVLLSLIQMIDFKQSKDKPHIQAKTAFLAELLKQYSPYTPFLSYFPQIVITICPEAGKVPQLIFKLFQFTKVSLPIQITIALSLYLSDRKQISEVGQKELQKKLKQFRQTGKGNDIPQKILEELLFQINQNPDLYEKLANQFDYLLDNCENIQKVPEIKIYKYLKCDWQYFASEQIIIQKPPTITLKKVDILRDLGPSATSTIDILKTVFSELGPTTQQDIFQCFMMISGDRHRVDSGVQKFITDLLIANKKNLKGQDLKKIYNVDLNKKQQNPISWNLDNFIQYCNQNVQNLKWQNVMNQFDRPKLMFQSEDHFTNLMKIFQKAKKLGNKFKYPESLYFKKWTHPQSQSMFLVHSFKCKQYETLGLFQLQNKRIQKSCKDAPIAKQIWGYLDMVQLLIQTSDYNYLQVRALFDVALGKYPDLLIQTLSQIRPSTGQHLLDQLFSQIFPIYLQNHSNYIRLLQSLWQANQDLVISSICQLYKSQSKKQNSINLSRVLDIAQVIKESLIPLTNWNDYDFAVPLAILAGKRQFLHFQPWITDRIKHVGNPFLKSILGYIEDHLLMPIRKLIETGQHFSYQFMLDKAQLNKQLLAFIFQSIFLTTSSSKMTKRNLQCLKRIYKEVCQYFPQMSQSQMPDQIQQLAERQFRKIYKKQITIQEAIEHMGRLKNSLKSQDKQLFASMITFMFSQLRFHASYPQNQLMITANLFAGIINGNLIQKKLFQVLLQVLQDDLKQDNKKYLFAKLVIQQIRDKLKKQPEFCERLIDNFHCMHKDPQMIQSLIRDVDPTLNLTVDKQKKLKQAIKIKNCPPQPPVMIPSLEQQTHLQIKKLQTNTDYDILLSLDKTKQLQFPQKQSKLSKINTTCNTLAISNIQDKARDLQKILDSRNAIKLLAYNIVFKRIPLAQNNGVQIFYRLVQKIPRLQKPVLSITFKILSAWFKLTDKSLNDKKLSSFKSLGYWLGKLTIGRGQPVPINVLNLREILVNSYTHYNCRLTFNISVILKILDHITVHKDIFRVSNPWLSKILGTLNEIQEKLKEQFQNSKSQIKAFFINTDLKRNSNSIPSTSYLNLQRTGSQFPLISRLPEYIKISEQLHKTYLSQGIDLKMVITKAVDDSIQQIVQPVIDRAVKIALVTTKQLIMKDFALEPDQQKFRNSCYNVVKKLAGPLAQVTCREPLKASMNRTLKTYLNQHLKDPNQVQNIISKAIPQNLDLGCALIKKAVIESGQQAIRKDEQINESIQRRISANTQNIVFCDDDYLRQIPSIVPQQLRPKAGGLSFEEFFIYDQIKKSTIQKFDDVNNSQKINEMLADRAHSKAFKQILQNQSTIRDQLVQKIFNGMLKEQKEQFQIQYYLEICQMLKEFIEPSEAWAIFKVLTELNKKDSIELAKKLIRVGFFPETAIVQLDGENEEENKAINLFQKWLDTAHQEIQPFLQSLQEIFNKSQNQIRTFFEYSLNYSLKKAENSLSQYKPAIDTTYIQDYSKLIVISYKLIASNNCSLYLEHTLTAILNVFNQYQSRSMKEYQEFFQRAFFKLFLYLICDITRKQYDFPKQKVTTFYYVLAKQFHKINPLLYPNFAFAWVELISNKHFMPTLLQKYEYWDLYFQLLCDLLKFVKQNITQENISKNKEYQIFYMGIIRLFIVFIHDFQDFLSAFSLQLCLHIPDKLIQIRNMVISAYPKDMKFANPSALKTRDQLENEPNIVNFPKYYKLKFDKVKFNQFIALLNPKQKPYKQLKTKLQSESEESLQMFILYFAWSQQTQGSGLSSNQGRKMLFELISNVENDLKDKLLKYVLNLVRYPNVITVFFIDLIVQIVFKQKQDKLRVLVLKKIFQRMNVQDPHSWGMLYLVKQFQIQKNELKKLQVPNDILQTL